MIISKAMYSFLKSYVKWIENGAIDRKPYSCELGLCSNALRFNEPKYFWVSLGQELVPLLKSEGLDTRFPFGKDNYKERFHHGTQHEDPIRLQWIKDHIEEYEKTNPLTSA